MTFTTTSVDLTFFEVKKQGKYKKQQIEYRILYIPRSCIFIKPTHFVTKALSFMRTLIQAKTFIVI